MYLFDPRQGVERRELWGERVRKGRDQAQSAVETGRTRVSEYRHRNDGATVSAASNGAADA
jgi:hypothetical protein